MNCFRENKYFFLLFILLSFCFLKEIVFSEGNEIIPETPLGLDDVPIPEKNIITRDKYELGKMLFFEKRLSLDSTVSCASCHNPKYGFSNNRQYGIGIGGKLGNKNVPTIINAAYNDFQFWNGRVRSLEEQAKSPLLKKTEMGANLIEVLKFLKKTLKYKNKFEIAFGKIPITLELIVSAIASYERTILSGSSPFDYWKYAGKKTAISKEAKTGFVIFKKKGKCVKCHLVDEFSAPFTDNQFHNLGIGLDKGKREIGRQAVTGKKFDMGKFKTPTLRNISQTAPYMHDGRFKTLREVIDFYVQGGIKNPNLDPDIGKINLTEKEKLNLEIFLRTLDGKILKIK
ncbi:MAG: cytochrome c peroxidase [Nitrospinota bacterium]|nr:cytochrome c peroxidase [Nitrospinota bacterium]